MGVYIDMEMPKEGYIDVRIKCNGIASFAIANNPYFKAVEAVHVPPHGRLIDADALTKQIKRDGIASDPFVKIVCDYFKDAPTIIPAEEGETCILM